jgi:hypothetical protein
MVCGRCNAGNPDDGKFCRSCGASLGTFCGKCGLPSLPNDRYCGHCGSPTALALKDEPPALTGPSSSNSHSTSTRQFTAQEIDELLGLRRIMKKEETTVKTLRQDDVDKLFG